MNCLCTEKKSVELPDHVGADALKSAPFLRLKVTAWWCKTPLMSDGSGRAWPHISSNQTATGIPSLNLHQSLEIKLKSRKVIIPFRYYLPFIACIYSSDFIWDGWDCSFSRVVNILTVQEYWCTKWEGELWLFFLLQKMCEIDHFLYLKRLNNRKCVCLLVLEMG